MHNRRHAPTVVGFPSQLDFVRQAMPSPIAGRGGRHVERMTADRVSDPLIGRLLDDRYLVGPRVARGGMATVYEATDTRLDRTVAVKVMHTGLGDDDSSRAG